MKKHVKKMSAFETSGGKYSSRKIPQWRISRKEILDYVGAIDDEREDITYIESRSA